MSQELWTEACLTSVPTLEHCSPKVLLALVCDVCCASCCEEPDQLSDQDLEPLPWPSQPVGALACGVGSYRAWSKQHV